MGYLYLPGFLRMPPNPKLYPESAVVICFAASLRLPRGADREAHHHVTDSDKAFRRQGLKPLAENLESVWRRVHTHSLHMHWLHGSGILSLELDRVLPPGPGDVRAALLRHPWADRAAPSRMEPQGASEKASQPTAIPGRMLRLHGEPTPRRGLAAQRAATCFEDPLRGQRRSQDMCSGGWTLRQSCRRERRVHQVRQSFDQLMKGGCSCRVLSPFAAAALQCVRCYLKSWELSRFGLE